VIGVETLEKLLELAKVELRELKVSRMERKE